MSCHLEFLKRQLEIIRSNKEEIVFGVTAPYHHIKGILLRRYKNYFQGMPPVLVRKLNELRAFDEGKDQDRLIYFPSDSNNVIAK